MFKGKRSLYSKSTTSQTDTKGVTLKLTDMKQLRYYKKHLGNSESPEVLGIKTDLCIYGGTPAGIAAAVQAKRMGLSVVIAEFSQHVGGIAASGLGRTDYGHKDVIGGISRQFYEDVGRHYGTDGPVWRFEPSIAAKVYHQWLEEKEIPVYYEQHLVKVEMNPQHKITKLTMENGNTFSAEIFIDATYEGDLMANAGVSHHIGRESNATYQETRNGIQFGSHYHMFNSRVDPYIIPGKPDSGLLYGIMDVAPGVQGEGDRSIQAYNFRVCLTNDPNNQVMIPEPSGYDPQKYELLARYIRTGIWEFNILSGFNLPNQKTDTNNYGAFSTDHIGANHEWPEGSYELRERIFQDHVSYTMGLLYFFTHDQSVPEEKRALHRQWGLAADEFTKTGHWPHQLYIRESRRMISEVVMTEQHCRHIATVTDSIGMASYGMDSHNCRRLVLNGQCINEGNVEIPVAGPYPISYRSIVPKVDECTNLLVPVCLSASHIAYGSIRMEPVFMILGQSAATAAALALQKGVHVQEVHYNDLHKQLLEDQQILFIN